MDTEKSVTERDSKLFQAKKKEIENKSNESVTALRKELDDSMKQIAELNAEISELIIVSARDMDAAGAVEERDQLRITTRVLQEDLEQSTEMLTRPAIDALGVKSNIRKLEYGLGKTRDELSSEKRERMGTEAKIGGLTEEISSYENKLDSLRDAKRSPSDECHALQLQVHEKDAFISSKHNDWRKLALNVMTVLYMLIDCHWI